ncbi:hypothetical protein JB92DRAFT_2929033 [Gautieria morchelliformis]|nr:hypothetical protein JB92DRAFT_2929033 [Gautieria morchelliformis]
MATTPLNPFRNRQITAQHTGSTLQSSTVSEPSNTSTNSSRQTASEQPADPSLLDNIPEDAPPAYTPTADPFQGEAAVEFGPHRPFQPAPLPLPVPVPTPVPTVIPSETPSVVVNAISVPTQSHIRLNHPPPPQHPSTARRDTNLDNSHSLPPPRRPSPSHSRTGSQTGTYLPPLDSPPHSRAQSYSPPPGQPPPRRPDPSARRVSVPGTGVGTSMGPDDGRPTTTPVPGHPLLKGGKLLVYPQGFECSKCHNTGYKNNDPSHACGKCWDKYARSYTGALAYAPFPSSTSAPSSSGGGNNFQRPLPVFSPPQANFQTQRPHPTAGHPQRLHRKHSSLQHHHQLPPSPPSPHHHPHQHHPGSPSITHHSFPAPHSPPFHPPPPRHPGHPQMYHPPSAPPVIHQPPHIIQGPPPPPMMGTGVVYQPGDPRIGGRLCWRCNGRGGESFLFFDWQTCTVCRGAGRVFN